MSLENSSTFPRLHGDAGRPVLPPHLLVLAIHRPGRRHGIVASLDVLQESRPSAAPHIDRRPIHQVRIDFGRFPTQQFAGSRRTLQRAGEHLPKCHSFQTFSERRALRSPFGVKGSRYDPYVAG